MVNTFWTSDIHWNHERIQGFTDRPWNVTEQEDAIVEIWNKQVKPGDSVYHLGDWTFGPKGETKNEFCERIMKRLNGNIFFILGNHDSKQSFVSLYSKFGGRVLGVEYFASMKINKKRITMCHFPLVVWENSHHGYWSLYGHCMDEETEVLTLDGFKYRNQLSSLDKVATLNLKTGNTEYQEINEFIDIDYTGVEYSLNTRNVNGCFTDNHTLIYCKHHKQNEFKKKYYKEINEQEQVCIPLSANNTNSDYPIDDNLLKLYIQLVADGSIENGSLGRFHLRKERKINRVKELLNALDISFSENLQKIGTTKINFRVPNSILQYSIKPLDNFILKLSKRQVDILLYEYSITDGCKTSKNGFQIATSKRCEADLLQHLFVTSGYSCNVNVRHSETHERYTLAINSKKVWVSNFKSKPINRNNVIKKPFWCLKVYNQTLIVRRHGKVHITGNCHGSYEHPGRALDVGLDNSIKVMGEYRLFEYDDLHTYLNGREPWTPDHHHKGTT